MATKVENVSSRFAGQEFRVVLQNWHGTPTQQRKWQVLTGRDILPQVTISCRSERARLHQILMAQRWWPWRCLSQDFSYDFFWFKLSFAKNHLFWNLDFSLTHPFRLEYGFKEKNTHFADSPFWHLKNHLYSRHFSLFKKHCRPDCLHKRSQLDKVVNWWLCKKTWVAARCFRFHALSPWNIQNIQNIQNIACTCSR